MECSRHAVLLWSNLFKKLLHHPKMFLFKKSRMKRVSTSRNTCWVSNEQWAANGNLDLQMTSLPPCWCTITKDSSLASVVSSTNMPPRLFYLILEGLIASQEFASLEVTLEANVNIKTPHFLFMNCVVWIAVMIRSNFKNSLTDVQPCCQKFR